MLLTLQSLWILMFSSVCWTFLIKTSLSRMIHSIWSKTKFEALDTSAKILAFRSCQIQYTVAAKPSLREKLTKLFPCQETVANRIHSSKLFVILGMSHLSQTFHHNAFVKEHSKNKWLWSSLLRRQSEHLLGPWIPNRWSLSCVESFRWIATQRRNACLGTAFLNHTMSCQSTIWWWILSCSQATLTEKLWFGESNQTISSFCPLGVDVEGIASIMGCQPIASMIQVWNTTRERYNGQIKRFDSFKTLLFSRLRTTPLHRNAILHLLKVKQPPETPVKILEWSNNHIKRYGSFEKLLLSRPTKTPPHRVAILTSSRENSLRNLM